MGDTAQLSTPESDGAIPIGDTVMTSDGPRTWPTDAPLDDDGAATGFVDAAPEAPSGPPYDAAAPDSHVVAVDVGSLEVRGDTAAPFDAPSIAKPTIYIAGDSTVSTYAATTTQGGWGQFLQTHFQPSVTVVNDAIGGRTARRFIDEGRLDAIWAVIHSGDYILVQFGTNDSNSTASYTLNGQTIPYYLDPATAFKTWLAKYIDGARARGATAMLVTPPPRRSCTGDSHMFGNGTGQWTTAMKELGAATSTTVVDLNQATLQYLDMIGCVAAGQRFFFTTSAGTVDATHFNKNGASVMAGFVADGIRGSTLSLAAFVK